MEPVLFSVDGGIATVVVNRPDARNSLNLGVVKTLDRIWHEVETNPSIKVCILTGSGDRHFLTGIDTAAFEAGGERPEFRAWLAESSEDGNHNGRPWLKGTRIWKPVISVVNGHCVATGMGILTASDIRLSVQHASFACLEVRLGQIANNGAMARLPRQIPYCHAMMLLLTGQRISAEDAMEIGLVNEVLAVEDLMPRALAVARSLSQQDAHRIQVRKQATLRGLDVGLGQAMIEEALYKEMWRSISK